MAWATPETFTVEGSRAVEVVVGDKRAREGACIALYHSSTL